MFNKLKNLFTKHPVIASLILLLLCGSIIMFTMYLANPFDTFVVLIILSGLGIGLSRWRTLTSISWTIFLILCISFGIGINVVEYNVFNDYMYTTNNQYAIDTTTTEVINSRISCTQIVTTHKSNLMRDSSNVTKYHTLFSIIRADRNHSHLSVKRSTVTRIDTLVDTLKIDELTCGDTIKTVQRKPYWDRDFSLIKVNKIFINSNWIRIDTTYYVNRSPEISDWQLVHIFDGSRAEFMYDGYITKYIVHLIDEAKSDTLDSQGEATELLNSKCKDKATIAGKLVYTEYDACKNNNNISTFNVEKRKVCGYSRVNIEYERGAVSPTPYSCWGKLNSSWYFE